MLLSAFILFAFLFASYYCTVRFEKNRLATWILFFFAELIVSIELLGFFDSLNQTMLAWLGGIYLALILFFELLLAPRFKILPIWKVKTIAGLKKSWFLILIFSLLALNLFFLSLVIPVAEIDSMAYHLPIVSQLLHSGSLWEVFYAPFTGPNTYFPANHEALSTFFALIFRNYQLGFIINLLSLGLFCGALNELGRDKKLSQPLICFSVLGVATVPFLAKQLFNYQIDLFLFGLLGASVAYAFAALLQKNPKTLIKFLLCFGLALGTKYNALLQGVIFLPVFVWLIVVFREFLRRHFWVFVLPLLTGGVWYLRNLILTGNPFYPFGFDLGFLHLRGHESFVAAMSGTSLWESLKTQGLTNVANTITSDSHFTTMVGKFYPLTLLFFVILAGLAVIYILIKLLRESSKKLRHKHSIHFWVIFTLVYLFFAEGLAYLLSPYTYTLWNETVRYSAPWLAIIPVACVLGALVSKYFKWLALLAATALFAANLFLNYFLNQPTYQTLLQQKWALLSTSTVLLFGLTSLFIFLIILSFARFKRFYFKVLLLVLLAGSSMVFQGDHFQYDTQTDDIFKSQEIVGYEKVLPFLKALRAEKIPPSTPIAIAGLNLYWLFEEEGLRPTYVNIDGCGSCQYPDYRDLPNSVRSNPNQEQWQKLLQEKGVRYLLVGFNTVHAQEAELYEKAWADSKPKVFPVLLRGYNLTLYKVLPPA